MSTSTTRRNATWQGAPLLDAGPFRTWLIDYMELRNLTVEDVAQAVQVDGGAVARWLGRKSVSSNTVSELLVERVGIALLGDPRLAAQLYPELDR